MSDKVHLHDIQALLSGTELTTHYPCGFGVASHESLFLASGLHEAVSAPL